MKAPIRIICEDGEDTMVILKNSVILLNTVDRPLLDGGSPVILRGKACLYRPGPPESYVSLAHQVMRVNEDIPLAFINGDTKDCRRSNVMLQSSMPPELVRQKDPGYGRSTADYWAQLTSDYANTTTRIFHTCGWSYCCSYTRCPRALPHLHDGEGACIPCSAYQVYTACMNPGCLSSKCIRDTRKVPVAFFARKVLGLHARLPDDKRRALAILVSYASRLEMQYRVQGLLPLHLPYDALVKKLVSLRDSKAVWDRAKVRRTLSNHKFVRATNPR